MRRFPIFLAAFVLAAPAMAFDGLWRDLAIVPANPVSDQPAFYYSAPDRTVAPGDAVWISNNQAVMGAMFDPATPTSLTGVDFTAVIGVFDTGTPPDQVAIIHGLPGFAAGASDVLQARGFTKGDQDGFTVLAKGEDHAINRDEIVIGEPFAGALGKSYRLAVDDDLAILGYSTSQMAQLTAALADSDACTGCLPWRSLLDAIRTAAGPDAILEAASGYPAASLMVMPDPAANADDIDMAPAPVPPYLFAMFAVTRDSQHHPRLFLSLLFADEATAQQGAKAAGNGMQALFDEVGEESSPFHGGKVTPAADGLVATLTIRFDHPVGAVLGYNRWIQLVMNRSFALLSPG